jgi:sulfatase maturation enzyme AslB (radical SAM superfamily)
MSKGKKQEVVRLTNLGNLTLKNLLGLEKRYSENAKLKRQKLAKLWQSETEMNTFEILFKSYHSETPDSVVIKEGEKYSVDKGLTEKTELNENIDRYIRRFSELGLVKVTPAEKPLEEIVEDIKNDNYANPIKYLYDVTVELTGLCNLKCKHCYRGGSREGEYGLPAEEIKKALEPLLRAGVHSLGFTGGEPTLRRNDLLDIIDYASQFLELNGIPLEERMQHKYGTPNPTVEDVLKTKKYQKLRRESMSELREQAKDD